MIITTKQNEFVLETENTTYAMRVLPTGQLEHLYYGKKLHLLPAKGEVVSCGRDNHVETLTGIEALIERHAFGQGNVLVYDQEHMSYSLEDMRLEMSSYGKGDIREPFVEIVHLDGSYTNDFVFEKAEVSFDKPEYETLPGSYVEKRPAFVNSRTEGADENIQDKSYVESPISLSAVSSQGENSGEASAANMPDKSYVEHLCITMKDYSYDVVLELHYYVFPWCNVITRSAKIINTSKETIRLNRLMSTQLDFDMPGYVFTTFHGAWAREMQRCDTPVISGKQVNSTYCGTSSSRANPFVMLHPAQTTEDYGSCYGINLIYSGNHYEAVEVNSFGKTRFVGGINPRSFCFVLKEGESFEAPEAVMTYSNKGYNGMSNNMHHFVREHIVRGSWKNKIRPVLLNSWEAAYFDINESKLVKLAKAGKEVGIELLVMDDGWFGKRNDDSCSLGDWDVNLKKLPGGLKSLADKINEVGLDFGIWVEPEMICEDSDLYRAHPDWSMEIPGKPHTQGRNQRILNLTNPIVQDFVIEKMTEVFSSANIAYVKWDMNRIFSDYFSQSLDAEHQGEVAHRYVCGLYRCMKVLTERFPEILFEGCSAGGNRFDLGILSYFPQIWASDDTDALCRAFIQTGYSYGYPMSTVTAHVSNCPNHQTLRTTPLETRFNVAAFGVCGYETNLCDMKKEDLAAIKAQIELYKEWREILQKGDFYRGRVFSAMPMNGVSSGLSGSGCDNGNVLEWTCVSEDGRKAVGFMMQQLVIPNSPFHSFYPKGLKEDTMYHFYNRDLKYDVRAFGDLINTASPIHVKPDSLMLDIIAHFVKMDGETEDVIASGDTLMEGGMHLKQSFGATGYNDEVRYFQDFGSRLYFMEATIS